MCVLELGAPTSLWMVHSRVKAKTRVPEPAGCGPKNKRKEKKRKLNSLSQQAVRDRVGIFLCLCPVSFSPRAFNSQG